MARQEQQDHSSNDITNSNSNINSSSSNSTNATTTFDKSELVYPRDLFGTNNSSNIVFEPLIVLRNNVSTNTETHTNTNTNSADYSDDKIDGANYNIEGETERSNIEGNNIIEKEQGNIEEEPVVFALHNFFSRDECEYLKNLIDARLQEAAAAEAGGERLEFIGGNRKSDRVLLFSADFANNIIKNRLLPFITGASTTNSCNGMMSTTTGNDSDTTYKSSGDRYSSSGSNGNSTSCNTYKSSCARLQKEESRAVVPHAMTVTAVKEADEVVRYDEKLLVGAQNTTTNRQSSNESRLVVIKDTDLPISSCKSCNDEYGKSVHYYCYTKCCRNDTNRSTKSTNSSTKSTTNSTTNNSCCHGSARPLVLSPQDREFLTHGYGWEGRWEFAAVNERFSCIRYNVGDVFYAHSDAFVAADFDKKKLLEQLNRRRGKLLTHGNDANNSNDNNSNINGDSLYTVKGGITRENIGEDNNDIEKPDEHNSNSITDNSNNILEGRSLFTVLFYLNDDFEGGETNLLSHVDEAGEEIFYTGGEEFYNKIRVLCSFKPGMGRQMAGSSNSRGTTNNKDINSTTSNNSSSSNSNKSNSMNSASISTTHTNKNNGNSTSGTNGKNQHESSSGTNNKTSSGSEPVSLFEKNRLLPEIGSALVFLQNGVLHEGWKVLAGQKYVIRTDLFFARTERPQQTENEKMADIYLTKARSAENEKDFNQAIAFYKKAFRLNPRLEKMV